MFLQCETFFILPKYIIYKNGILCFNDPDMSKKKNNTNTFSLYPLKLEPGGTAAGLLSLINK